MACIGCKVSEIVNLFIKSTLMSLSWFYRRHRNMQPGVSVYEALMDTLDIKEAGLTMTLLNAKDDVKFKLEVTGLSGGMVRMRIMELEPLRPRYEPPAGDILVKEPELSEYVHGSCSWPV
jgi:alpha 1,3-glucosidase